MPIRRARVARPEPCLPVEFDPDSLLLTCIGEVAGERALILGRGALVVMCALIRAGATEVTELCRSDRPEPASADLVVVAGLFSTANVPGIIGHSRRALGTAGRIVLRCPSDPSGRLTQSISRVLRLHGFSALRMRRAGMQTVVTAELPLFGPTGHA